MRVKDLIGRKIEHKTLGVGTIVDIDGVYVTIDFNSDVKKFQVEALGKFFNCYDEDTNKLVQEMLLEIESEKMAKKAAEEALEKARKEEAERKAREEAERLASEKKEKNKKKSQPIHPYIDERRSNGKHAIFLVCQKENYEIESNGGYIWAPDKQPGKTDPSSWAELELVRKGDIIVHHFANKIWAISVAKNDYERKAATTGHPNEGIVGRYVELSYHFLENPADTSDLKAEKIAYGSMKYGPFEVTGKNKEGFYLSELADAIAKVFIDAAIAANPSDVELLTFKNNI